ncbi:MAG: ribose-phosphate pyrophosphokinase [Clostridiaceae bacterium]|nr:ribose-phosphate pyrophosphokinase [Clostridiaceae bacterium]
MVFGGSGSIDLTAKICRKLNICQGRCKIIRFSEGNIFVQIDEDICGIDVYVVQSIAIPVSDNLLELLFLLDACKRANAKSVTAVIPYFSYGKGDKMDNMQGSIRARVCADAIVASGADRVIFVDLHTQQIQGFFNIPVSNLHALPLFCNALKGKSFVDPVIVAPDIGFIKQARSYAKALECPVVMIHKERIEHDEKPVVVDLFGDVKGKTAIIVDDFIATGGTLLAAAHRLSELGTSSIWAAITHGLFTMNASEKIKDSPIEGLTITDTVENSTILTGNKIYVLSVAPLICRAILGN